MLILYKFRHNYYLLLSRKRVIFKAVVGYVKNKVKSLVRIAITFKFFEDEKVFNDFNLYVVCM